MINLETRTADPALAFHVQHYLDATAAQKDPAVPIKEWLELDHKREACLTAIALETGLIDLCPPDGILPPSLWRKVIAIVQEHIEG